MKNVIGLSAALLASAGMAAAATPERQDADFGKYQYEGNCASCHGMSGKGDGHLRAALTKGPADLTMLAKTNGGVFPTGRVWRVIDGREIVGSHGMRDMPVWGRDYLLEMGESGRTQAPFDAEAAVKTRILALIDYLHRLQVK